MIADQPTVALIIVAFNHADHLPATFEALARLEYTRRPAILLVENGDGSSAAVARRYAGVEVLEPGRNLGFAGGCNWAVAQTDADVIVLINPDLQPQPDFLQQIIAPLSEPQVGIVGAKLLYPDGETIQHAGGLLREPLLLSDHLGYGARDTGQHDEPRDVAFVTGAALALRRATWQKLGGLDDSFYPAYYEEADLCLRARQHGLLVRYQPSAVALHYEAAGIARRSAAYYRLYHRNRLRLLFKHHPDRWLLHVWLPAELAHLRTTAEDDEISGLLDAYLYWQTFFTQGAASAEQPIASANIQATPDSELGWTVAQVQAKRNIVPQPFRSRWPLVARLRGLINRIATEDYVRPLIQQQNDYNAALAELAGALERQRRTADAAIVCQGALLAKLLSGRSTSGADEQPA